MRFILFLLTVSCLLEIVIAVTFTLDKADYKPKFLKNGEEVRLEGNMCEFAYGPKTIHNNEIYTLEQREDKTNVLIFKVTSDNIGTYSCCNPRHACVHIKLDLVPAPLPPGHRLCTVEEDPCDQLLTKRCDIDRANNARCECIKGWKGKVCDEPETSASRASSRQGEGYSWLICFLMFAILALCAVAVISRRKSQSSQSEDDSLI